MRFVPILKKIILSIFMVVILVAGYKDSVGNPIDFAIYHSIGKQLLQGNFDLYPSVHLDGTSYSQINGMYYRYAPVTALLFVPFALFDVATAAFLFFLLKIAALFGVVLMISKLTAVKSDRYLAVGLIAFFSVAGYIIEDWHVGNVHFLSFFLIVLAIYGIEKGRVVWPSFLLALAVALKITPLLFVFYFLVKKKFKVCAVVAVSLAVLFLLPALFVGFEKNAVLVKEWSMSAAQKSEASVNHSLKGVLFKYLNHNEIDGPKYPKINVADFSRETVYALWLVLGLATMIFLAAIFARASRHPDVVLLEHSLVVVGILILSPHSMRVYFSTLLLPSGILVILLIKYSQNIYRRLMQGVLVLSFLVSVLIPAVLPGRQASLVYEIHSPYFFATTILFFVLVFLIRNFEKLNLA